MDYIDLLFKIGELNKIFKDSASLQNVLEGTVRLVTDYTKSDACSIYYYDSGSNLLSLQANAGVKPPEGQDKQALEESGDLVVPIVTGLEKIGVLVLRRGKEGPVIAEDVKAIQIITSQLANLIEISRLMSSVHHQYQSVKPDSRADYHFIKGKVASEGYHYSGIFVMNRTSPFEFFRNFQFENKYSKEDFLEAVLSTDLDLSELQKKMEMDFSEATSLIFGAHLLMLRDPGFTGEVIKLIEAGENPPTALIRIAGNYIIIMHNAVDKYMREKAKDIEDIAIRVLTHLVKDEISLPEITEKIVIAKELLLSDLIRLYSEKVGGIILLSGGVTTHLSILARTLKIPVIIADDAYLLELPESAKILMDAEIGNIYINPGADILLKYDERNRERLELVNTVRDLKNETRTKDGVLLNLMVNINLLSDLKTAENLPYEGVGLYRTEMPFLIRKSFPEEEDQYLIYKKLVDGAKGKTVTFRTLDIGGDKLLPYFNAPREQNPFLGLRSVRFSLENRDIFQKQIRAILRAGQGADIKIMFPMVSSLEEFITAKNLVLECSDLLSANNIKHIENPPIGMMVEVPSVVELIEDFANISDFFSIGTNDLIQYLLAVDRTNESVAGMYIPHHPAVLRAIYKIVSACLKYGKEISICGSMANRKEYLAFLIGSGIRNISVEPAHFPEVQKEISGIDTKKAASLVEQILQTSAISEIERLLNPAGF
jgi:phosphotransferase system enzyme I (PtsP)